MEVKRASGLNAPQVSLEEQHGYRLQFGRPNLQAAAAAANRPTDGQQEQVDGLLDQRLSKGKQNLFLLVSLVARLMRTSGRSSGTRRPRRRIYIQVQAF